LQCMHCEGQTYTACNSFARSQADLKTMFGIASVCAVGEAKGKAKYEEMEDDPAKLLSEGNGWGGAWENVNFDWVLQPNGVAKDASLSTWKTQYSSKPLDPDWVGFLGPSVRWRVETGLFKSPFLKLSTLVPVDLWKFRHGVHFATAQTQTRAGSLLDQVSRSSDAVMQFGFGVGWAAQTGVCQEGKWPVPDAHALEHADDLLKGFKSAYKKDAWKQDQSSLLELEAVSSKKKQSKTAKAFTKMIPGFLKRVQKMGIGAPGFEWTKDYAKSAIDSVLGLVGAIQLLDLPMIGDDYWGDANGVDAAGIMLALQGTEKRDGDSILQVEYNPKQGGLFMYRDGFCPEGYEALRTAAACQSASTKLKLTYDASEDRTANAGPSSIAVCNWCATCGDSSGRTRVSDHYSFSSTGPNSNMLSGYGTLHADADRILCAPQTFCLGGSKSECPNDWECDSTTLECYAFAKHVGGAAFEVAWEKEKRSRKELWAMITSGYIWQLSKYFTDTIQVDRLFEDMDEIKVWACASTELTQGNPFKIWKYIKDRLMQDYKAQGRTCDVAKDDDLLCNICKGNNTALKAALQVTGLAVYDNGIPESGLDSVPASAVTAFENMLACNLDQFGVGRFVVGVVPNTFWNMTGNWSLTVSISMLSSTRWDSRLLDLLPSDYKVALLAQGFPNYILESTGGDFFGLNYVESWALASSAQLRGYVYQCGSWQQTRKKGKDNDLSLAYLGERVLKDCFQLLQVERNDFCEIYRVASSRTTVAPTKAPTKAGGMTDAPTGAPTAALLKYATPGTLSSEIVYSA